MPLSNPVHISPQYVYERGINLQDLTFGSPILDSKSSSPIDFYVKMIDQKDKIEYELATISLADIYEDQVNGWFFNIVLDAFDDMDDAGFIILMTALSFFESHAQFLFGIDTKNEHFGKCFKDCFQVVFQPSQSLGFSTVQIDTVTEVFYQNLRNGLFHTAMIRRGIELNRKLKQPFKVNWNKDNNIHLIVLNPILFAEAIQQYFHSYIQKLKQDSHLQKNLETGWSFLFKYSSSFIDIDEAKILTSPTQSMGKSLLKDSFSGGTLLSGSKSEIDY